MPFFGRMFSSSAAPLGSSHDENVSSSSANASSPGGPIRMLKSRKATRGSPYGGGRQHSKLDSSNYEESMLGGDEDASDSWVAEKHVGLKIDRSSKEPKHGIKLQTHPTLGVIVSGLNPAGQAARNGLNVGDQLRAIDGEQVKSHVAAMQVLDMAVEGRRLTLTASGSTRAVTLDKTMGDLGMTCSNLAHTTRGVLLKRINRGSLADAAAIYCGDTILAVNEQLVDSHEQAVALMNECRGEVRLVLWGQSTEVTLGKLGVDMPLGITVVDQDRVGRPGVKVEKVVTHGLVFKAGISVGDTLLSVDGVICTDHKQAVALLTRKDPNTGLPLSETKVGGDLIDSNLKVVFMNKYNH